jgi:hypothetical protein
VNLSNSIQLINEALSRVRMRVRRGSRRAEVSRPARIIAMRCRAEQDRQLGL